MPMPRKPVETDKNMNMDPFADNIVKGCTLTVCFRYADEVQFHDVEFDPFTSLDDGIRGFVECNPSLQGYTWNMRVYTSKHFAGSCGYNK